MCRVKVTHSILKLMLLLPDVNDQFVIADNVLQVDMSGDFANRNVNVIIKNGKLMKGAAH